MRSIVLSAASLHRKSATEIAQNARLDRWLVWLATIGTAGSGVLNIYSVLSKSSQTHARLLADIFPLAFQNLSRHLTLLIGFALVTSSINIWKRKRRAWRFVILLSSLSVVFHLTKDLDYEAASVSLLLFFILWFTRREFKVRSGPPDVRQALIRIVVGALVVLGYAVLGFWLLELTPQTPYTRWFTDSIYVLTFTVIIYAGLAFFRPIIYRLRTLPRERLQAAKILRQYGHTALDFFKLWRDKSYYFNDIGDSFVAYRVGNNFALALADPVGPEVHLAETVEGFSEFCRANDWGVAFYQTPPTYLATYHKLGFKRLKIGDEAIVDLMRFTLEGKPRRNLRANLKKFENNGFHIVQYQPPIADEVLRAAKTVSDDWLSLPGHRERLFSLGMFDEAYVRTTPLYTLVDPDGTMVAFVNRIQSYRRDEATIDLMRHRRDAPNGAMDYLFTKLLLDCKAENLQRFSLGMAPLDGFRESEQPTLEERAVHYFVRHLNFIFSYSGLRHYKAKFADTWEPRYLIYQNTLALPKIALALTSVSELRWARQ
ncbi:MAG TPA: phosphatidylglycerol lysyltransferase domain-containing protein [Pyrinomonadaceae bacterium]|nr:phosphatidylglycerol lysyltransferase domain-containing protein [Pyrinomonadaceae bacterium]